LKHPANPLQALHALGQSVWLDYIEHSILTDGTLSRWITEDAVTGLTSNPAIFEKAMRSGPDYRAPITRFADQGLAPAMIYEAIAFDDIRHATELLRPVYEQSHGRDGFVSFEISPHLAEDAEASVSEAVRIWKAINRSNLMIKVPATPAGTGVLRRLVALGINVNATLLFSVARYREIADAWLGGLEESLKGGQQIDHLASVASFFLSRIDTLVDARLDALAAPESHTLRGRTAIACARLAYQEYQSMLASPRWQRLARAGAQPQRLLWASTSTKDPAYSDTKYVEALIGPDTVNTLTPETLAAYRDHGQPAVRIEEAMEEAEEIPARLKAVGIDLITIAGQLEREGVQKFIDPYDRVLASLESRRVTSS